MLPVRLEIKNFLAYRETVIVNFDGMHLACLTGPNGAGKSSLLDAMTWALWGEARTGNRRTDELIHFDEQDMHVQLDFLHEGEMYRVLRKRARKGAGTTTLDLFAHMADGSWNAIGEATIKGTESRIVDLLRLDYTTFTHSAFLQQGKANSFVALKPAERKDTLAEILGIRRFQVYEKAAKEQAQAAKNQIDALTTQLTDIEDQLSTEPELRTALRESEERHAAASAALDEADARLREVEHVPQAVKDARTQAAESENRLTNARRQLADAARRAAEAAADVAAREAALARRETVEAGYQELQHARSESKALETKFKRFVQLREQIHGLESQVDKRRAAIEKQIGKLDAQITNAETIMAQADPAAYAAARDEAALLADAEDALKDVRENISTLEQERSALQGEKTSLDAEMLKLRERWRRLNEVDETVCPLCGQPLDAEHRQQTLTDIQSEGTGLKERIAYCEDRSGAITVDLTTLAKDRQRHEAAIKRLQGSVKTLAQFEERQQRAQAAETERDQCAAQRETLQRDLAEGGFAAELTAQINEFQQARDALGYDEAQRSDTERRLSEYESFEQDYRQLQLAMDTLPGVQRSLEAARENETLFQGMVETETVTLESARTRLESLTAQLDEFQKRRQTAEDLRRREREADNDRVSRKQSLAALDNLRTRRDDLTDRLAVRREQRGVYEELAAAFGKNGIPAMLIETAIPEIEEDANALLWKMTGGRMSVSIITQREKKSGDAAIETLEFVVSDELGQRSYDTFSGGEAFRVNFALRVALSQLLARRAGAHLRALFLDEGFGTQDEEGRARLVEAITAVQDRFDLILVITHIEELRESFPVHLLVTKTETGSRVAIR